MKAVFNSKVVLYDYSSGYQVPKIVLREWWFEDEEGNEFDYKCETVYL